MSETENKPTVTEQEEGKEPKKTAPEPEVSTNGDNETATNGDDSKWLQAKDLYQFTVKDIDGKEVSMSKYEGKPTLIINVASNCGFTKKNYNQLNELYEKYESKGLRIAAFPCNQFAGQEPGCETDIKEFAKKNNAKYDFYSKIDVNGANAHPLYRWLKTKQRGFLGTSSIKWNFTKFLIDKEGNPIKRFSPTTSPLSIESDIQALVEPK